MAPSTGGGSYTHFFSPDGRQLGFSQQSTLRKVPIQGGVSQTICKLPGTVNGGTWGEDGTIIVGTLGAGLFSVSAAGGEPQALTTLDSEKGEQAHSWPDLLPGGKAVLFTIIAGERWENVQIAALDLETGRHNILFLGGNAHYSPTGHLVYGREGAIWAVAFDPTKLEVIGEPVPVLENVDTKSSGAANFSFSDKGSLVYLRPTQGLQRILVWVDRESNEEPLDFDPRPYSDLSLSPDGKKIAVEILDYKNPDLWILSLENKTTDRFTRYPQFDSRPLWTPEGERIVFASNRQGHHGLYWKAADATEQAELLVKSPRLLVPASWSADGKMLVIEELGENIDIGVVPMEGEHIKQWLLHEEFNERHPAISPGGRWIAYASDESGQYEIYVRPFPNVDERKWLISRGGGTRPVWARDGRELFYRNGDTMMVIPIMAGASFSYGIPTELFEGRFYSGANRYDISLDGQRFLMIKQALPTEEAPAEILLVQNWFEELKRLVPTDR